MFGTGSLRTKVISLSGYYTMASHKSIYTCSPYSVIHMNYRYLVSQGDELPAFVLIEVSFSFYR